MTATVKDFDHIMAGVVKQYVNNHYMLLDDIEAEDREEYYETGYQDGCESMYRAVEAWKNDILRKLKRGSTVQVHDLQALQALVETTRSQCTYLTSLVGCADYPTLKSWVAKSVNLQRDNYNTLKRTQRILGQSPEFTRCTAL